MKENRFGSRLKSLRLEMGLTHDELAKKMGKSRSSIGLWENMKRSPDLNDLLWLSDFFDCTVDYLLGNSDDRSCNVYEETINGHQLKISYKADAYKEKEFDHEDAMKVIEKLKSIGVKVEDLLR